MPRAARIPKYKRQARLQQELKAGLESLKKTRATLRAAEREAMEGAPRVRFDKFGKIPKTDYRLMAKLTRQFGLYDPAKPLKYTPSQQRTIRKKFGELEYLLETSTFAPTTGLSKKAKGAIARDLRAAHPTRRTTDREFPETVIEARSRATKKGIWLQSETGQIGPRRGKQQFEGRAERVVTDGSVGRLKFDRETGLWTVQVQRRTKSGLRVSEARYIAGAEAIERKEAALLRMDARRPKLERNQRLSFFIGKNPSSRTFRNMRELVAFARRYRKSQAAQATFLGELKIVVVQKGEPRYRYRGRPSPRTGKRRRVKDNYSKVVRSWSGNTGRSIDPDMIEEMLEDLEDDDDS